LVSPQQKHAAPALENVDALILCGGLGTRLRSAVADRPKGLALVAGRPFLDILVDDLVKNGFRRLILCVGYGADQIAKHFEGRTDAEFVISAEPAPLGTGGALRYALPKVRSELVAVVNGDSFCPVDYFSLLRFHLDRRSEGTLVVTAPEGRNDAGAVQLSREGRVTSFLEKPAEGATGGWVNAGIYFLKRDTIAELREGVSCSLERDVIGQKAEQESWYGYRASGPLIDIGTPERYERAQDVLRRRGVPAQVPISVVLPCYRNSATVAEAIRSIHEQVVTPLEVIAVDDASGDDTPALLQDLGQRFGADRFRLIAFSANRGPSAARNAGWEAARGEFVAFLDADDTWHPRKLEIQYRFMRKHKNIALSGHRHSLGELPYVPDGEPAWSFVDSTSLLWRNRFVTPSVMVRRDLKLRFEETRRHMEDHLLWMQAAFHGHGIALIEAPLVALHKRSFGDGGLSADLLEMERGELANYASLFRQGFFGRASLLALQGWSLAKFLRRLAIVAWRRLAGSAGQQEPQNAR
jgi:NDP-sugar pyrophosphorylase family protein